MLVLYGYFENKDNSLENLNLCTIKDIKKGIYLSYKNISARKLRESYTNISVRNYNCNSQIIQSFNFILIILSPIFTYCVPDSR